MYVYTCVQSYTLYNEQSKLSNSGRSGSSLSDPIMYTCELRIIPTLTVSSLLQISTTARGRKFWTPVWLELLWAMPASTMHTGGGRRTWRATSRAEDTGKGTLPRKMVKRKIVNSRIARGGRAHSPLPPTIQTRTQVGVSVAHIVFICPPLRLPQLLSLHMFICPPLRLPLLLALNCLEH